MKSNHHFQQSYLWRNFLFYDAFNNAFEVFKFVKINVAATKNYNAVLFRIIYNHNMTN